MSGDRFESEPFAVGRPEDSWDDWRDNLADEEVAPQATPARKPATVERSYRMGSWHHVTLSCGHRLKLNADQMKAQQIFIGKAVECAECAAA